MILLSLLVLSMSLSATAIYDPNNTVTDLNSSEPQLMKTTAEPVPISKERDYQLDFSQQNATCGGANIDNVSITVSSVSENETTANIEGVYQTPNPCHTLTYSVEKEENQTYILSINQESTSDACVRCIGNINYEARLNIPDDSLIEVNHNSTKMAEALNGSQNSSDPPTAPETEADNQDSNKEHESKGFFADILESLENLF